MKITRKNLLKASALMGLSLPLALQLQGCNLTGAQKADEAFDSAQLPAALESLANPAPLVTPEFATALDPGVRVAVIDLGVDYRHPYIAQRLAYTVKDGKITAIGRDVQGADDLPHPNLINAKPFSFGAEITDAGKIRNPLADPLAKFAELSSRFGEILDEEMQAKGEDFVGTYFTRFNKDSVHLYGASFLVQNKETSLRDHKDLKEMNLLVDETSQETGADQIKEAFKSLRPSSLRKFLRDRWTIGDDGMPAEMAFPVEYYRGFDTFVTVVEKALDRFESETGFSEKYLAPFTKYRLSELAATQRVSEDKKDEASQSLNELFNSWLSVYRDNYGASGDMRGAAGAFCNGLSDADYDKIRSPKTPVAEKEKMVLDRLDELFVLSEKVDAIRIKSPGTSEGDRRAIARKAPARSKFKEWYLSVLKDRGLKLFFCNNEQYKYGHYKYANKYLDFAKRTNHPYLDRSSATQSHGTHVAGVILAQEPTARIVPVRVITASRAESDAVNQRIQESFLKNFEAWLKDPLVNQAVTELLSRKIGDLSVVSKDASDRLERSTEIVMKRVNEYFPAYFEQKKFTHQFFSEVIDAIKYVGDQKVKIANVSLGTEFENGVTPPSETDDSRFEDVFEFLVYEYFKYEIGSVLKKSASKTLFVIAAGNSGKWLDGRTRSGLPCDLSSPFLEQHEAKLGVKAPNNDVKNILCVGSINNDDELSSFTNILLTQVPFVVSKGESIPSAIRSEDCEGVDQRVERELGYGPSIMADWLTDEEAKTLLSDRPELKEGDEKAQKKALRKARDELALKAVLMSSLSSVAKAHECVVGGYVGNSRMTGTSMASPAVAGRMGRLVAEKEKALGITDVDAYDREDFSPTALIRELTSGAPVFGGSSIVSQLRKITDLKDYPASSQKSEPEVRQIQLGDANASPSGARTLVIQ